MAGVAFWPCLIGGVAALGGAFLEGRAVARLRRDGLRTQGVLIDNVETRSQGGRMWVHVVGFTDNLGHPVEFAARARTSWKWRLGRVVRVIYLPERPHAARLDSWGELRVPTFILLVAGIVLMAVAVGLGLQLI